MRKSKNAYCEKCDKDVEFEIVEEVRNGNLKGVSFKYVFKKAVCKNCGEQVFPVSVGKDNYIAFTDAYKSTTGLLTTVEIFKIRKELKLTQTGLAKKIVCGEKNIARYEMGAIQLASIDQVIRKLAEPTNVIFVFGETNPYSEEIKISKDYISNENFHNKMSRFTDLTYEGVKMTPCNV